MKTYRNSLAALVLLFGLAAGYAQTAANGASQASAKTQAANGDSQKPAKKPAALQSRASLEAPQSGSSSQNGAGSQTTDDTSVSTTPQKDQAQVQNAIDTSGAIRFKGITLSPTGSFLAGETVYRNRATGGGINTPFTAIPLPDQPQYYYSEFYGSGRQSRVALLAEGRLNSLTMRGYYEADFLNAGVTSNNNQSNSYPLRQRQVWAQAELDSGWTFTGGQMWSLATENLSEMTNRTEAVPLTIDPQYEPGFVWARQYAFRATKDFSNKMWLGVSAENPQVPSISGHNLPYNFLVGQAGTGGGLYNPTANYSSNPAPDLIAKVVAEPGWGHYEIFGIGRFFRDRVYPSDSGSAPSAAGAYNYNTTGGGVGGSLRVPTLGSHLNVGLKGLWGDGVGRYGDSQIADTTVNPEGQLALIHGFSALSTLEWNPTTKLVIYLNYGGDYVSRSYFVTAPGKTEGYGAPTNVLTGCAAEVAPTSSNSGYSPGSSSTCTADTKDVQQFTAGYWYDFYRGAAGRLRQGLQYTRAERDIWSGVGPTPNAVDNMFWTSFRYYLP